MKTSRRIRMERVGGVKLGTGCKMNWDFETESFRVCFLTSRMTVTFQKRWRLKIFFHLRWGRLLKASSSLLKISFTVFINSLFSLSDWHWWPQTTKWHTWPTRQVMCEWWKFVYSVFFLINVFHKFSYFLLNVKIG